MKESIEKHLFGNFRKLVRDVPLNKKSGIYLMVKRDMEYFRENP
jgi:hypothetical protein